MVCIHDVRQTTLHGEARCRLGLTEYSFHDPLAAPDVGIRAAVTGRVDGLADKVARDYDLELGVRHSGQPGRYPFALRTLSFVEADTRVSVCFTLSRRVLRVELDSPTDD